MTHEAIRAAIMHFWLLAGAHQHQAEVLLKKADVESQCKPDVHSKNGRFHCLYQWGGERYADLLKFSNLKSGCPSLLKQLEFAAHELHQPKYACFWKVQPHQAPKVLRQTFGHGASCP